MEKWSLEIGSSLVELLQHQSLKYQEKRVYTFLASGETESGYLTYLELDRQAKALGAFLQSSELQGERALLLYHSGLEYIVAFWGCLYAGVIAVPAYPPRANHNLLRLQNIVKDAKPRVVLTTSSILAKIEPLVVQTPDFSTLEWLSTDDINNLLADRWKKPSITENTLAFLQYTSGSMGAPKGVMVSHGNILHNEMMMQKAFGLNDDSIVVGWLPLYHDLGLIGNIMQTLYSGTSCVLMSPVDFLQKPYRWLKAVSDYRATISGGPNFAYELCINKITEEQKETLDLNSWKLAFTGAEPVRYETLEKFSAVFKSTGFNREALYPCYGMAEATLLITGGLPEIKRINGKALERNLVISDDDNGDNSRILVGCGHTWEDQKIVIVDPDKLIRCSPGIVGEIWAYGLSNALGYWNKPELTENTFHGYLSDSREGPFLRTGDLGFIEYGQLFVTGRLKDLIIIKGSNHYPHDIELTVEHSHQAIRPGCCAAVSVEMNGEECLGIVAEIERQYWHRGYSKQSSEVNQNSVIDEIHSALKKAVFYNHQLQVSKIILLKPGSIPKTSSGKIQRYACRNRLLDEMLSAGGDS